MFGAGGLERWKLGSSTHHESPPAATALAWQCRGGTVSVLPKARGWAGCEGCEAEAEPSFCEAASGGPTFCIPRAGTDQAGQDQASAHSHHEDGMSPIPNPSHPEVRGGRENSRGGFFPPTNQPRSRWRGKSLLSIPARLTFYLQN